MNSVRIRITYSKSAAIRYTGHLDMQHVWERTFRRSKLPVAYSQGFNPQVRLQIASALPLGFTSRCELLDFWLEEPVQVQEIIGTLNNCLAPGILIIDITEVDPHLPALQTQVISNKYEVTLLDPPTLQEMARRIRELLTLESLPRTWRKKSYDLRALIEKLEIDLESSTSIKIRMQLSARQNATGRPEEVLSALGCNPQQCQYERTDIILSE
jgi:radical SAM-linked protein